MPLHYAGPIECKIHTVALYLWNQRSSVLLGIRWMHCIDEAPTILDNKSLAQCAFSCRCASISGSTIRASKGAEALQCIEGNKSNSCLGS